MSGSTTPEDIRPYLVLAQADDGGQPIVETARALHDLIVTFPPQGYYSVRTVEDECGPAIHCAFERKIDADRLATAVGAIKDEFTTDGTCAVRNIVLTVPEATVQQLIAILEAIEMTRCSIEADILTGSD